ncbi:chemotaxis protein MotB [Pseudorhodobacter sp. E13]|uniref:flagellar motor protein MotB n=1 Tax=Pseudorhodobacter sp. E13 TaxID=2487931 RepID=UPI000F8C66F6|nr:flagellar motor protein MotB [Pseudorhodobacter sp. E13]RUS61068.1 chemotaxis protein MotB [Pseudorhodobacter sp. E13]
MDGQSNARPVIIKRKKVVQGGGHHGGAWKVAYADFVTAMMAFFMLMWLLNATTEKQRKGLADYFSPTIPINRISGGGDGAFGGDSVVTDTERPEVGVGAPPSMATETSTLEEADAASKAEMKAQSEELEKALAARSGESMTMERALRHVVTKLTDEGLVIEIFDLEDVPLFDGLTATPEPVTRDIAALLADVLAITRNTLAVNGHVRSFPITLVENPAWAMSSARAQAMRGLLQEAGIDSERITRISGYADRKPVTANPMAVRNNRLEVILLRKNR